MKYLYAIHNRYTRRGDIPSREQVPELKGDDRLLYLTAERVPQVYDVGTKKLKAGDRIYYTYIIDPDRIPTVERQYLDNIADLLKLREPMFRPDEPLTREECNTRAGRMKLLSWFYGFPQIVGKSAYSTLSEDEENPLSFWDDTNRFGFDLSAANMTDKFLTDIYKCLLTPDGTKQKLTKPPVYIDFFPDTALSIKTGADILTRDQFAQIAEKYDPERIPVLLKQYEFCQKMVDRAFATYTLFRTEKYDAIANLPIGDQRAAVHNYFATFYYFGRGGMSEKAGGSNLMTYKSQKYVVTNTAKTMGIPSEAMTPNKKQFVSASLFDKPKEQDNSDKEQTLFPLEPVGYISKEPRKQRTDYGKLLKLYFSPYIGKRLNKDGDAVINYELLKQLVTSETAHRKLYNELMYAITSRPEFDVMTYAKKVQAVESKEDIAKLFNGEVFEFDASKLIKSIYGAVTPETSLAFEITIRGLPNEPFVFYRNIKTTKDGKEILIHIDANTKEQYPQGTRELTFAGPRFSWIGWADETVTRKASDDKKTKKKNHICYVHANPINLANMLGNNGQLTNFDQLTPEYMAFNRDIRNDDHITPAVEKILAKEYGRRFPSASIAVRGAKKAAKKNNGQTPNKQTLDNVRKQNFKSSIDKDKLFVAVCNNTGRNIDELTNKQRHDIRKSIERSLQLMEKHGVIIDKFSSSDNGSAWNIEFVYIAV